MHENTNGLPGALRLDSGNGQGLCVVGGEPAFAIESRTSGLAEATNRSNEIKEIAANLERLCIEYACQSRVNGVGNETRAVWAAFKDELARLKGVA